MVPKWTGTETDLPVVPKRSGTERDLPRLDSSPVELNYYQRRSEGGILVSVGLYVCLSGDVCQRDDLRTV